MATSGSFETRVPSSNGFIFRLEWSLANQSVTNNTSTVNVILRWIAPSGWTINASVSRPGSVTAAGTTSNFSHNASLTSGQNRVLWSGSRTVTHNANGTGSFSLSATWAPQVTLSGVWVHTVSLASRSFTLPTIARASTINANPSWTALTGSLTTQITRASSAFSHSIRLQVRNSGNTAWVNIGDWRHFTGTSHTFNLAQAEFTILFNTLAGRTSASSRVELMTRNGSTATSAQVGSTVTRDGTVTAPNAISATGSHFTVAGNATSQTITITVNRANNALVSDIQVRRGTTVLQTFTNQGTPTSLVLDGGGLTNLRNQLTAGVSSLTNINLYVTTRYQNGGPVIRSATSSSNFTATFANIHPTLSGTPTYQDTLGTTTAVTGNNQWIIQNQSRLSVVIPANFASANQGATISSYEISIGNRTETRAFQTAQLTVSLNEVNLTGPTNLSIRAIDSRGNSSTQTIMVQGVSYGEPTVNANAFRNDGFAHVTTLTLSGTLSPLTVNGVHRNTVNGTSGVQRRQRTVGGTWTAWTNWTSTTNSDRTQVSTNSITNHSLDNEQAWELEFRIIDALATTTIARIVPVGAPTLFIDPFRSAVSVNGMPTANNQLAVNGAILENGHRLMRRSQHIPEGSDLNDSQWREEGNYHNSVNVQTQTILNRPSGMNIAFSLSVHRHSANHSEGCHQVIRSFSANQVYIRSMTNNGRWTVWSEFSRILNGHLDNGHTRMASNWIGTHNNNNFSLGRQNAIDMTFVEKDIRFNKALRGVGASALSRQVESGNLLLNGSNTVENTAQELWMSGRSRTRTDDRAVVLNNNVHSNGSNFNLGADGTGSRIQAMAVFNRVTTAANNIHVTVNGVISRSTSATKYKLNINEMNVKELAHKLLTIAPKSWYDKYAVERYAEHLTNQERDQKAGVYDTSDYGHLERICGLVAEDVVEAGLGAYVHWSLPNEDGSREIEGIQYERLWTLLIPLVKELKQENDEQSTQIKGLTENINKLNERLEQLENKYLLEIESKKIS